MQSNFPKIPLFLSTIFFMFSLSVFLFLYQAIDNKNKESQLKEEQWQTEMSRREGIKTLDNTIKMVEGDRLQLETHFAQSSDIVPFLDTIEGLAPKAGAKAEVTSVDIAKDSNALVVSLKASGTFASLYKFLTLLENSPYELDFMGVEMHKDTGVTTTGKGGSFPQWNVIFKMKLLSFVI